MKNKKQLMKLVCYAVILGVLAVIANATHMVDSYTEVLHFQGVSGKVLIQLLAMVLFVLFVEGIYEVFYTQ